MQHRALYECLIESYTSLVQPKALTGKPPEPPQPRIVGPNMPQSPLMFVTAVTSQSDMCPQVLGTTELLGRMSERLSLGV